MPLIIDLVMRFTVHHNFFLLHFLYRCVSLVIILVIL